MMSVDTQILTMSPVLLYLDPGTGGLLFSILMGSVMTGFFVFKGLYFKCIGFVKGAKLMVRNHQMLTW